MRTQDGDVAAGIGWLPGHVRTTTTDFVGCLPRTREEEISGLQWQCGLRYLSPNALNGRVDVAIVSSVQFTVPNARYSVGVQVSPRDATSLEEHTDVADRVPFPRRRESRQTRRTRKEFMHRGALDASFLDDDCFHSEEVVVYIGESVHNGLLFRWRWQRYFDGGEGAFRDSEYREMRRQGTESRSNVVIFQQVGAVSWDTSIIIRSEQESVKPGDRLCISDTSDLGALSNASGVLGGIGHDQVAVAEMWSGVVDARSKARQFVARQVDVAVEARMQVAVVHIADGARCR